MSDIHQPHSLLVDELSLTSTYQTIWSGDVILVYALLWFSSDEVVLSVHNNGAEVMIFYMKDVKSNFDLDSNELYSPLLKMYSSNRWCLDFRSIGGMYPQGVGGALKLKSNSGSNRTLNKAMIIWSDR